MNIQELRQKIKPGSEILDSSLNASSAQSKILLRGKHYINKYVTDEICIVAVIILVGFAGFGLGRLSLIDEQKTPVSIEYAEMAPANVLSSISDSENQVTIAGGGLLVGSKNGSKYHFPWCSGAQRMKEKNKIWFASKEEAQSAGYEPAKNCKGL